MKQLKQVGISEMKAKEQRKLNGGVKEGGCIINPLEGFPFPPKPKNDNLTSELV